METIEPSNTCTPAMANNSAGLDGHRPRVMIIIATDIIGGPGKGLFQFLKFADRRRFDYLLCNYKRAGITGSRDDFLEKARAEGIAVHLFSQRAVIDPLVVLQAIRMIRRYRINIVQTHSYKSNLLGCVLKLLLGTRWIAFAHGYTSENRKMTLYNRLDQLCYTFADLAVVVSEPLKRLLIANHVRPERIVKLPNAVDIDELVHHTTPAALRRELGLHPDAVVVGVIGRLSPEKGQLVFLEALQRISSRFKRMTALIIGDGPQKEALVEFCRARGLADRVVFTGHVVNVGDYYNLMNLLVIPSYSEGLPNVLLEAMAVGVPVVATRVGAVEEVLDDMPDNLVAAGDVEGLAERMARFLSEDGLARLSVLRGKEITSRRYDPAVRAVRLVDLYDRVARRGRQ